MMMYNTNETEADITCKQQTKGFLSQQILINEFSVQRPLAHAFAKSDFSFMIRRSASDARIPSAPVIKRFKPCPSLSSSPV